MCVYVCGWVGDSEMDGFGDMSIDLIIYFEEGTKKPRCIYEYDANIDKDL